VLGFGPLEAGLAFLPFTAGIMVSAGLASRFSPTVGVRPVAIVGMVVSAVGMLLLTRVPAEGSYPVDMLPALIITSLGMGAVFVPLTLIATTGLKNEDQGLASGLFNTSQQIGGALGLAILSTLAAGRNEAASGSQAEKLVTGFHWAFAGGAAFVIAGLVLLLVLLRREDVEQIQAAAAAEPAPVPVG
jgi:MFS family permease